MAALKELKNNSAIIQTSTYFQDSEETVINLKPILKQPMVHSYWQEENLKK